MQNNGRSNFSICQLVKGVEKNSGSEKGRAIIKKNIGNCGMLENREGEGDEWCGWMDGWMTDV